jgi:hypothetical protein
MNCSGVLCYETAWERLYCIPLQVVSMLELPPPLPVVLLLRVGGLSSLNTRAIHLYCWVCLPGRNELWSYEAKGLDSRKNFLDEWLSRIKAAVCTQHKYRINSDISVASGIRTQGRKCLRDRRHLFPMTARPLWSTTSYIYVKYLS